MPEFTIGRLRGGFAVSWQQDGRRRRYQLAARSRKEAEAEAIDVIRKHTSSPGGVTISDIWREYREDRDGRPIARTMGFEEKAVLGHFGALRPDQLTPQHVSGYTTLRREAGRQDGTIWTELGHLRTALRWAVKRKKITDAPHIERPPKPAPKDRWLTHAEIARLLDAATMPHVRLAILLMLGTAARVGAVLDLTWDRIDLDRRQIDLRISSTGPRKGRAVVPMNNGLRDALIEASKSALSEHVVEWGGDRVLSIKKGFSTACRGAKLTGVTPHVLRHTSAVHLAASGIPMSRIAAYLGHSSEVVTAAVYARYAPDHLREEADILDFVSVQRPKEKSADAG